jgi:hypothetical protein
VASAASIAELRKAQAGVTALVRRDLSKFYAGLDLSDAEAARDALLDYVPRLVNSYGEVAATVAADWYDGARQAAGARGSFRADLVVPDNTEAITQTIRRAVGDLFGEYPDPETVLNAIAGKAEIYALEGSRLTITNASIADPSARGWQRVAQADACSYCQDLTGIDFDFEPTFDPHIGCNCIAVPNF